MGLSRSCGGGRAACGEHAKGSPGGVDGIGGTLISRGGIGNRLELSAGDNGGGASAAAATAAGLRLNSKVPANQMVRVETVALQRSQYMVSSKPPTLAVGKASRSLDMVHVQIASCTRRQPASAHRMQRQKPCPKKYYHASHLVASYAPSNTS